MRKKILVLPPMALAFLLALAINTQSQSLHTLTVHGPRPLAKAVNELQVRYRIPITYEDPPFSYENDYDDKTAPQFWGSGKRALIPKEGSLEVEYRISDKTKQPENPTALLVACNN